MAPPDDNLWGLFDSLTAGVPVVVLFALLAGYATANRFAGRAGVGLTLVACLVICLGWYGCGYLLAPYRHAESQGGWWQITVFVWMLWAIPTALAGFGLTRWWRRRPTAGRRR